MEERELVLKHLMFIVVAEFSRELNTYLLPVESSCIQSADYYRMCTAINYFLFSIKL